MKRSLLTISCLLLSTIVLAGNAAAQKSPAPADTPVTSSNKPSEAPSLSTEEYEAIKKRIEELEQSRLENQKRINELQEQLEQAQEKEEQELSGITDVELGDLTYPNYRLSGFMDVNYINHVNVDKGNELYGTFPENSSFFVGNLNLYNDIQLSSTWRVFFEIRFLFQPNGDETSIQTSYFTISRSYERIDTTSFDYLHTLFIREQLQGAPQLRWGGIEIERAWVDWNIIDYFNIRLGLFLSPYGIWNIDHASPIQFGIMPPFAITAQMIPERQAGIQLYGRFLINSSELGYHLTLSNGRGPADTLTDYDDNKAFGGRLYYSYMDEVDLTLGTSWYVGEFTDIRKSVNLISSQIDILPTVQYDELVWGGDFSLDYSGMSLDVEFIYRRILYNPDYRPEIIIPFLGITTGPDYKEADYYQIVYNVTLAYTLPWIPLTPFFRFNQMQFHDVIFGEWSEVYSMGVQYRIIQPVVIKGQYLLFDFSDSPEDPDKHAYVHTIAVQLAVAF